MARPELTLRRLGPDDADLSEALALIQSAFAYMDGRIDPPSSVHRLDLAAFRSACVAAEVWALGRPIAATVILTPKSSRLYIGKLAVAPSARGRGLARLLVDHAAMRARALGLEALELEVRIELTENQKAFGAIGFTEVARSAHPGYDRPTSITMRRMVRPSR